ncbi:MAG: TonB-dependent receptor [Flavobacteriales bacterium]|nr:TonB-dependent receptor [Flavobacteriales bacterium]
MKILFSSLLFFCSAINLIGQDFKGTVLNKETLKPISFVQVYFVDLKTGTTTNEQGVFHIEHFKQKNIHLQLSFVGYDVVDNIINTDSTKEQTFYMLPGHIGLDEVVVSAPNGRLQGENIVNIDHKKISELQETSPLNLAEAISTIPGVDQTSTGSGIGKPVIRGLSGNRIITYAQGIRIENQQWGDEHGLGVGDVGIESVEVIKGPASLLYGSDALGGVLYFIDERYASHNTVEGFAQSKFLLNTLGAQNNAGFKIHKGSLKFNLFGTYTSHADYQVPSFSRVLNTRFDEHNIKSSFGFNTKNWISNIRYSYLKNNFGIVEDGTFSEETHRNFESLYQSIENQNLSFDNVIFTGKSNINLTLGYINNYRKEFEEEDHGHGHSHTNHSEDEHALGLKLSSYTYNLKWYSASYKDQFDVVIGTQGMLQNNLNDGEEVLIPDASTNDLGAFVLGNLKLNKLQLQSGIRADVRSIDTKEMITEESIFSALKSTYTGFTFSGGAVYKLNKIKYRANISSGFRAPNTTELLSNGVHHGTNRFIRGDVNLISERAIQSDFSFDYQHEHLTFSINPFFNSIQNYIFLIPTDTIIDGSPVFKFEQTNALLYGGEVGLHYHPHKVHWLHIESNLSTVFGEDKIGNRLPLIPQTKISSTLRAEFKHKKKVHFKNIFVNHIYRFDQNRIGIFETVSANYTLLNAGLNIEIHTKSNPIEITTGVKNMLNINYIDHLSRFKTLGIQNQGINFYIGLKIKFSKELKKKEARTPE